MNIEDVPLELRVQIYQEGVESREREKQRIAEDGAMPLITPFGWKVILVYAMGHTLEYYWLGPPRHETYFTSVYYLLENLCWPLVLGFFSFYLIRASLSQKVRKFIHRLFFERVW